MLKKIFIPILILFMFGVFCLQQNVFADGSTSLRSFDDGDRPIMLPKGSFLQASMQREVSTAINRVGDEVRMISTSPVFAADAVVVPADSLYFGKIIEINQPIEGINGSLRIQINKVRFPNGEEVMLNAMLWAKNHNLFGGELTMPAYYVKMPHFTYGWKGGALAFQNSGIYKMGVPTVIKAGAELIIVLEQDTAFYPYRDL